MDADTETRPTCSENGNFQRIPTRVLGLSAFALIGYLLLCHAAGLVSSLDILEALRLDGTEFAGSISRMFLLITASVGAFQAWRLARLESISLWELRSGAILNLFLCAASTFFRSQGAPVDNVSHLRSVLLEAHDWLIYLPVIPAALAVLMLYVYGRAVTEPGGAKWIMVATLSAMFVLVVMNSCITTLLTSP